MTTDLRKVTPNSSANLSSFGVASNFAASPVYCEVPPRSQDRTSVTQPFDQGSQVPSGPLASRRRSGRRQHPGKVPLAHRPRNGPCLLRAFARNNSPTNRSTVCKNRSASSCCACASVLGCKDGNVKAQTSFFGFSRACSKLKGPIGIGRRIISKRLFGRHLASLVVDPLHLSVLKSNPA